MGNRQQLIRKSNELVVARYRLSIMEMRVFLKMISMIKPQDQDFCEYKIYLSDIIDEFEITSNASYAELRKAGLGLLDRKVSFMVATKEGLQEVTTHMVVSVSNLVDTGSYIMLSFHPKMKHLLLELKERYLSYDIKNIIPLPTVNSIRIYELLKQYEKIGKRELTLDDLKSILQIEGQYKQYSHLRQRILDPAQENLTEHCDISFTYEVSKKKGRKVLAIMFTIFPNTPKRKKKQHRLIQQITDLGIAEGAAKSWCATFPAEQVEYHINQVRKRKDISNPGGYLRSIISQPIPKKKKKPKKDAANLSAGIIEKLQASFRKIWEQALQTPSEKDWKDFEIWAGDNPYYGRKVLINGKVKDRGAAQVKDAMKVFLADGDKYQSEFLAYAKEKGYLLEVVKDEFVVA